MTSFDFSTAPDRAGSDSIKWRRYAGRDVIPMWVADMDFAAPPAVLEALHARIDHGVFGYADAWPSLVGLAYIILLGTIAGSGLWTMLMGRYPAGMVAPLSLLVPVVGIGASWLFLHEDPSPLSLVGAVIVIAGASAAQMRRKPANTVFSDTPAASPQARLGV